MFSTLVPSAGRASRAALLVSAFALTTVQAAEPELVDGIVVTATRAPVSVLTIGDSITLIDAPDVRASQKTAVSDLLSATPGVSVSRNGGFGGTTSVRIRGAESEQTVVLIDGVKLNDPSAAGGGFNFGNLLVNDIARIEVLRGSQSTLWGGQAIGGVVNIVTSEPTGDLTTGINAEAGSYGTGRVVARVQAGNERYGWRIGGNYFTTDGISAFDEDLGGREDDGYRNVGFNARGHVHITDSLTAELRSNYSRGRVEFDGFPPPAFAFADTREYGITKEWVSYAGVKLAAFENRLENRVGIAYTDTDRDNFDPDSSVPRTFDAYGTNLRYEYQGTLTLNEYFNGVFGVEREQSKLSSASPTPFEPNPQPLRRDVTIDSAYAQLQVAPLRPLTLTGGLRYDDHETFGSDTSSQAAVAWSATESTTLRASYGEGFKAPTLYQLYSEFGNPALDPEESNDWDAGVEQRFIDGKISVSATYFERETRNMIDFVSCFGVSTTACLAQPDGYYENVQRTHADGYELAFNAQLVRGLRVSANYTNLDARNDARGTANFDKELPRRARDSAAASVEYEWTIPLTTTLAAQYVGKTFDDAANRFVLDSYTLLDLRVAYRLSDAWEVYGRIENLTDENYSTARRYGTLGRAAYLGVRAQL